MNGCLSDYATLGRAYDAFIDGVEMDLCRADRDALAGNLRDAALVCGMPSDCMTPLAWTVRRLATLQSAFRPACRGSYVLSSNDIEAALAAREMETQP